MGTPPDGALANRDTAGATLANEPNIFVIACGVAVCPCQRTGWESYVVIKSDNAISCIKMRVKVIAAASGGRQLLSIAKASGSSL
jgi:hypothetical protein